MKRNKATVTTLTDLIGQTPLVRLDRINSNKNVNLYAKLEYFNPSLSIKDRMVYYILNEAEKYGKLKASTTIVEASSGNTAASIAMIAAIKDYKVIITIPNSTSDEKIKTARAYGAEVIVCPNNVALGDSEHYVTKAQQIASEIPDVFMLNQYDNQKNIDAHYQSTGPELWQQTEGRITHLVTCASTGGTVSGVAKYLKEQNTNIKVIISDPPGSVFYHYSKTQEIVPQNTNSMIEGAGKKYIPECLHFDYIDEVVQITDEESFNACRHLAKKESILVGGSAGAALAAALKILDRFKTDIEMVVIMADSGVKYLSKIY